MNSGKIGQVVAMGGSGKTQDFFLWYEVCIIYILTKSIQFLYIISVVLSLGGCPLGVEVQWQF